MKKIFSFIAAMLAMIMICHAQANRQLSNLISPTAVNVNLLPGGTTGTKNLGSDTKRWKNGYFNGTVYCYGAGNSYGVYGNSNGTTGYGVYGNSNGTSGYGVYGNANGFFGYGGYFYSTKNIGLRAATGRSDKNWAGVFDGNVYAFGAYQTSDQNLKKNIEDFGDAMNIINRLRPRNYEFRKDGKFSKLNLPQGKHYGLISQELQTVLPNLISDVETEVGSAPAETIKPTEENGKASAITLQGENKETGTKEMIDIKAVNYIELIPIIIKALQELDQENTQLKSELEELKQLVNQYIKPTVAGSLSKATLGQNHPNPFTKSTVISLAIPAESTSAKIVITQTGSGKLIKTLPVSIGASQLTFDAASLAAGTYAYTLYVDGKKVDTKQMVITR
jgi:hypothetical protein